MNCKNQKKILYIFIILSLITCTAFYVIYKNNKTTITSNSNKKQHTSINKKVNKKKKSETIINTSLNSDRFKDFSESDLTNDDINIPVLCYHDVNPKQTNDMLLDPNKFEEQMKYLKTNNYVSLTMSELYGFLRENKKIPKKSVVITFDDGYIGNYKYAYPILKKYNMHACMFMISDMLTNSLYVNEDQLKELSDSNVFEIQSHTAMHEDLTSLSKDRQIDTMKKSKEKLESITNKTVEFLAYPYGKSNKDTRTAAKETGYKLGFSLDGAMADKSDNDYNIDRLYISNDYDLDYFIKKITTSPKNPE